MTVALPTAVSCGSIEIVYVPETGRDFVSTKPPFEPNGAGETRAVPSGFRIDTLAELQQDWPIDTSVSFTLMRLPPTPVNVRRASWPGTVVVTDAGVPPAVIEAIASGGTS